MDIQVASNFERLLFDLHGRDGAALEAAMQSFETAKTLAITEAQRVEAAHLFSSASIDEDAMARVMRWASAEAGKVIAPHTAIGLAVVRLPDEVPADVPVVTHDTPHQAMFRNAVARGCGEERSGRDRVNL